MEWSSSYLCRAWSQRWKKRGWKVLLRQSPMPALMTDWPCCKCAMLTFLLRLFQAALTSVKHIVDVKLEPAAALVMFLCLTGLPLPGFLRVRSSGSLSYLIWEFFGLLEQDLLASPVAKLSCWKYGWSNWFLAAFFSSLTLPWSAVKTQISLFIKQSLHV